MYINCFVISYILNNLLKYTYLYQYKLNYCTYINFNIKSTNKRPVYIIDVIFINLIDYLLTSKHNYNL